MKKNRIGPIVALLVFIIIGFLINIKHDNEIKNIDQNKIITTATIYKVIDVGSKYSGVNVYYTFKIGSIIYKDDNRTKLREGNSTKFINKQFPVAYSSVNPKDSKLLISEEDFELFNLPFPDSLHWTLQYLK